MLTIQPNFTTQHTNKIPFRGKEDPVFKVETPEDEFYNKQTSFYEKQKQEFEDLLDDERTPKFLKKLGKAFKIGSEVLFQGWLVAWGASKGAKFVKSSVISGVNSNAAKSAMKTAGKFTDSIKNAAGFLFEKAGKAVSDIKSTQTYMNFAQKFENLVKRLDENKYGHYVMAAFGTIGSGIKKAVGIIKEPFVKHYVKLSEKMKNTDFGTVYDKTAKAASTTLGVGAGATCAYDEIVHPEKQDIETVETTHKAENPDKDDFDAEVQRRLDIVEDEEDE